MSTQEIKKSFKGYKVFRICENTLCSLLSSRALGPALLTYKMDKWTTAKAGGIFVYNHLNVALMEYLGNLTTGTYISKELGLYEVIGEEKIDIPYEGLNWLAHSIPVNFKKLTEVDKIWEMAMNMPYDKEKKLIDVYFEDMQFYRKIKPVKLIKNHRIDFTNEGVENEENAVKTSNKNY